MSEEFSPKAMLIRALNELDNSRARSQQTEIGPSSLGDCRRKVYHQIKGTPETNPNQEKLAAILGTFIHTGIEKAIASQDPFGNNFLTEIATSYSGMPGHVDLFIKDVALVVDWKTQKLSNLRDFPTQAQIWQVQTYGLMLSRQGYDVKKVSLVVIPRDGRMDQIAEYIADFDPIEAMDGLNWLDEIYEIVDRKMKPPRPERNAKQFCTRYCGFYDETAKIGCPGL